MKNILVDSSVWIEYFKGNKDYLFVNDFISDNLVCTNDVILTELLPSMMHRNEHNLISLMNTIHKYKIEIDWKELEKIQLANIQHGNNSVPIADLIIVQNCMHNDLVLLTLDKHFKLISNYLPLKLYAHLLT
jgi:predicted nucleic acid-binding protein